MSETLYLEWNDGNNLNVPILDEQLRALYALINSLHYFLERDYFDMTEFEGNPFVRLYQQFATLHFMTELELMKRTGYPEMSEHESEHEEITEVFGGIYQKILDSGKKEDVMDGLDFFGKWWPKHITDADSRFALFYKRQVAATPLYIVWNEKYALGIPIVDEQHRGFVAYVNTVQYFVKEGWIERLAQRADGSRPFQVAIQEYMRIHFRTEEELMAASGYADIALHRDVHRKIVDSIRQVSILVRKSADTSEGLKFLKKWWLSHIQQDDRKFAEYFKARESV